MVGYCVKDWRKDRIDYVCKNVMDDMIQEDIDEYIKHGKLFKENCVVFMHTNLVENDALWFKYKEKWLGTPFVVFSSRCSSQAFTSLHPLR